MFSPLKPMFCCDTLNLASSSSGEAVGNLLWKKWVIKKCLLLQTTQSCDPAKAKSCHLTHSSSLNSWRQVDWEMFIGFAYLWSGILGWTHTTIKKNKNELWAGKSWAKFQDICSWNDIALSPQLSEMKYKYCFA